MMQIKKIEPNQMSPEYQLLFHEGIYVHKKVNTVGIVIVKIKHSANSPITLLLCVLKKTLSISFATGTTSQISAKYNKQPKIICT
jgi:hypothetical protein